jgi:patatin-related protein
MAVSPQADCEYEQEIRFAVVLYGGVSLAIYINGIAQELLRMVRGTANFTKPEKLTGTELIYRELGQRLGLDGASKKKIEPDSPPRTRFVVDIISGTSAGGINGVALAKALALKCRDLSVLKRTWLEEAQLDLLLNDKKSDWSRYPVGSKTNSLLNSERMYGKILETLLAMNDPEKCTADAMDFADKIDLFVTANTT